MNDHATTIGDFLNAAAARQPTPGGGSVAALVGALAASMGEMSLNYSVNKKGLEQYRDTLQTTLNEMTRARKVLLQLMVEDQLAFETISALRKLPADSPEARDKIPAALLTCIRIPETIAATCVALLDRCDQVVDKVNHYLLSDLAVCADLAMATARCAAYNVRVNLTDLEDPADRQSIETAVNSLLTRATILIQRVSKRIWERHAQSH